MTRTERQRTESDRRKREENRLLGAAETSKERAELCRL